MLGDYFKLYLFQTPAILWGAILIVGTFIDLTINRRFGEQIGAKLRNMANGMLVCAIYALLVPLVHMARERIIPPGQSGILPFDFPSQNSLIVILQVAAYYVIVDFFYYWWHRAQHRFRPLWLWHGVHHSDTNFNATTYVRQHWSEIVIQAFVVSLPVLFLFGDTTPPVIAVLFFTVWNFFVHADVKIGAGFWSRILTTPQQHRIHHALDAKHHNKNFAAHFPIWDLVFGTYCAAEKGVKPPTGLEETIPGLQMRFLK